MRASVRVEVALLLAVVGCSREPRPSTGGAAPPLAAAAPPSSLGNVMVQAGRRFEVAGRAAQAGRFELAKFEAEELGELFERDVPHASMPDEGPTVHILPMAKLFLETHVPELEKAAESKDLAAFRGAFERAAAACNACHTASAKRFIEIPSIPGKSVPDLDPPLSAR